MPGASRGGVIAAVYENRVPPFKKLRVGKVDAQRGAQARKELGVADFTLLVVPIKFVARKSSHKMRRLASGVTGPAVKRPVEVDIEHHAAEIEQERVGDAGREQG